MKARTAVVTLGLVLTSLVSACADDEQDAEYQETCVGYVNGDLVRVDDDECDGDDHGHGSHWFWYHGHTPVAVGQKVNPSHGSYIKPPAGASIARPPAKGGFGTFRTSSGGS